MKPFEIQSTALSIGGVKIDTSASGNLVLPGVTHAGSSVAIEVYDTQDQTHAWTADIGHPEHLTILDGYTYAVTIAQTISGQVGWTAATYAANGIDSDGFITDISVVDGGAGYTGEAVTYSETMWASKTPSNSSSWIEIPFMVRCGAGEIQSDFSSGSQLPSDASGYLHNDGSGTLSWEAVSGSSGLVQRTVSYPLGANGDTKGTIALDPSGTTYICIADYVAPQQSDFTVLNTTANLGQGSAPQGYQSFTINLTVYTDLLNFLSTPPYQFDVLPQISVDGGSTWIQTYSYAGGAPWNSNPPFMYYTFAGTALTNGQEVVIRYATPVIKIWKQADTGNLKTNSQTLSSGQDMIGGEGTAYIGNNTIDLYAQSNRDRSWAEVWIRNEDTSAPKVDIITRPASPDWNNSNMKTWSFTHDGTLLLPGNAASNTDYTRIKGGDSFLNMDVQYGSLNNVYGGSRLGTNSTNPVDIVTDFNGVHNTWRFDANGGLTFPDSTTQTTAYTGAGGGGATIGYILSVGDLNTWYTNLRVVTIDNAGYAYYCGDTNGNTPGISPIVIKVNSAGAVQWQTTLFNQGTVTSAYVMGSTIQLTFAENNNTLHIFGLNTADGTESFTPAVYNQANIYARDIVLGTINGSPEYAAFAGYAIIGGVHQALFGGPSIGGNFGFTLADDQNSNVEYYGITNSADSTTLYMAGYSNYYGGFVTSTSVGSSVNWHMGIALGHGSSIQATSVAYHNGFIYVASNNTNNGNDGFLTKMDAVTGAVVWQRGMGYNIGGQGEPFGIFDGAVVVDGNGDIIVAWNYGSAYSQGTDLLIVKFNPTGNCQWQRSIETANADFTNASQSTENITADSEYFYLSLTADGSMGPSIGGAIKLPLDGSGVNAYGVWTYRPQTWHVTDSLGNSTTTDITSHFTITPYTLTETSQTTSIVTTPAPTTLEVVYGSGNRSSLVNGGNSVVLDSSGNLNIPDHSHSNTKGRIQSLNGYPTLMAYGSGGHGGPELDWTTGDNPQTDFSLDTTLRHTMYLNSSGLYLGMNENQTAGSFSGHWQFDPTGTLQLPDESIVGRFLNETSNGSYDLWFASSVTGPDGVVYAIGGESNTYQDFIQAQRDNVTLWRKAFDYHDYNDGAGGDNAIVTNIKYNTGNDQIYVGFNSGNSTGVVSLNPSTGEQTNSWVVKGDNTNGYVRQYAFTVNSTNEPIMVGRSSGGFANYNGIAGTLGVDGSGTNYITVALSDIGNPHLMTYYNGGDWEIDIDGSGNWNYANNFGWYVRIPVEYNGTPGTGGLQVSNQGVAYSAGAVTGQNTYGIDIDTSLWTDQTKVTDILAQGSGTEFTIIIGSLTPGVGQTVLTFSSVSSWNNTSGTIYHMDGNFTVVSGTGNMNTAHTDILSITFGTVMQVYFGINIQENGYKEWNNYGIDIPGTNYQNNDTLVVKGSSIGGVDGAYIMSATPVTCNGPWYFSKTDYPSLNAQCPAGTLVRFVGIQNNLAQTVVSVADNGDGDWAMVIANTPSTYTTNVEFFAGNDLIFAYNNGGVSLFAGLPPEHVRLTINTTITPQSTYNIRLAEGQQAFVWTPNWSHTYGLTNESERFVDVAYDSVNHAIFLAGRFYQPGINPRALVIALDANNGNTLWEKYIGDNNVGNYGDIYSIDCDPNGNIVTVGYNDNGQAMITKQNGVNGSVMWQTVQTNQGGWNSEPMGKFDTNGDVYYGNTFYKNNIGHYVLSIIKLHGNNGSLAWAKQVDNVQSLNMYDLYQTQQQTISFGYGRIHWAGYASDVNNSRNDAIMVSLPQDGSGMGTYGRWIYTDDTDVTFIVGNDYYITNPIVTYVPTDLLVFVPSNPSISMYNASGATITIEDIRLGGGRILFSDGSDIAQAGIGRALQDKGNNQTILDFTHNGKFLHFYGSNGNSTVRIPNNSAVSLPIGFTVTLILDDFNSNSVYVNTGGDTSNGLRIAAVGFTQNYYNANWWRLGANGDTAIFTIMKVDTNRWVLSGPNILDDY